MPDRAPTSRSLHRQLLTALLLAAALLAGSGSAATAQEVDLGSLWNEARGFDDFLSGAEARRATWLRNFNDNEPDADAVTRASSLPAGSRILAVAEDWCGDSVHTVPYLARLANAVPQLELRVIDSERGAAIMRAHLTPDGREATPTLVLLDSNGEQLGAWVERPSQLQEWFLANPDGLRRNALYDAKYEWYEHDRGRSTVDEVLALLAPAADVALQLEPMTSGVTALLQAVSAVDDNVVWVSGHEGTWARSGDGGTTWTTGTVVGHETLQFRDVHALSASTAWLLSAGNGAASRIFRTDDGGGSWREQFRNTDENAFFDCFDFWDARSGVAFSDSVDGSFVILRTDDGGEHWQRVANDALPAAQPGEGSFAASGTCVVAGPDGQAWIGTGAADTARILYTSDRGASWSAVPTPVAGGPMAGLASLAFRDARHGMALGGDIGAPEAHSDNVAVTDDGGATWTVATPTPFPGPVYGSAYVPDTHSVVAVGPGGVAVSAADGARWQRLSDTTHWAVGFGSSQQGWAVGPGGRITRLRVAPAAGEAAPRDAPQADQAQSGETAISDISPDRLLQRMADGERLLLLDVRRPDEFAAGHVPGAVNISHTELAERLDEVRAAGDVDVVLYCRSGRRAGLAHTVLRQAGFDRLLHLEGDMLGWTARQLPIETPQQ